MDGYEVNLYYSLEDGYYVAQIVEFVGCATDGPTAEEALANLREVKAAWIEAMRQSGHPIPSPRQNASAEASTREVAVAA